MLYCHMLHLLQEEVQNAIDWFLTNHIQVLELIVVTYMYYKVIVHRSKIYTCAITNGQYNSNIVFHKYGWNTLKACNDLAQDF